MQKLIIVESPKKAQLIQGFLKAGKLDGYKVMASAGHIRDLKPKGISIDLEHGYTPLYEVSADKKAIVRELKAEAKKSELVYLASDEDREGEAIAWHLKEALGLDDDKIRRIVFHEITQEAFLYALEHPREIDMSLVDAQQARRVLDRIVGFELSPVLWRRIKPALSAGRVQSVAVRLIVEREREINAFVPQSSYRVVAVFALSSGETFSAELNHRFTTEADARALLEHCALERMIIADISSKAGKRTPSAPFTTSTLQQEASNRLGYSPSRTMRIAQTLYESGYITYMRTDSVNLSSLAMGTIASTIREQYGNDYYQPRQYQTKSKGAQEAHEAIRPTYVSRVEIEGKPEEQRLYTLIRRRTLASQMSDAQLERTVVTIPVANTPYAFIAQGEVVTFRGFMEVYMEGKQEELSTGEDGNKLLPPMRAGESLTINALRAIEKFSQRPSRYTEASMVSKMEELGIGRPSTYAPTIQIIQQRGYVERSDRPGTERCYVELSLEGGKVQRQECREIWGADKGKLIPTDVGIVVNDFLVDHFKNIVDYNFTARVEGDFDLIAEGDRPWQMVIDTFYQDFHPKVEDASERREGEARVGSRLLGVDPSSGLPVTVSIGRYGPMVQIGSSSDEQKPRFASLGANQSIDTISLEEALSLFALPRQLGLYGGAEVAVGTGRYGPYIVHQKSYISLPKGMDPLSVTLEDAISLIDEKRLKVERELLLTFEEDPELEVRDGRYGPYIKYKGSNYKIPKGVDPGTLDYATCKSIVDQAPAPKAKRGAAVKKKTTGMASKNSRGAKTTKAS